MIGMSDYQDRCAELTALGINSTSDIVFARLNRAGVLRINSFELKNVGKGDVTFSLWKRGREYAIVAEDISTLRVGATDRFRGQLAQLRIKPGTIVIVDTNAVVPQRIEDTNKDGKLWQTDGPVGPTYPMLVGEINYNTAVVDFTLHAAVTLPVAIDYTHANWTAFTTPVTFNVVKAGGYRQIVVKGDPVASANILTGMSFDEQEIGFVAKKTGATEPETTLNLTVHYHGNDEEISLPIIKGEIDDYPYHNA